MNILLLSSMALAAQDVTLTTADGVKIHALAQTSAQSTKGILMVHQLRRRASDWEYLAEKLNHNSFQIIAPDLRGHGENVGEDEDVELEPADYKAMIHDVTAAVAWLKDNGVTEISCIGSSIGANLCLQLAATEPAVANLVLLSPGLNYKGVTSVDALAKYGERPLLLVASSDDSYAARTVNMLDERAKGQRELILLEKAGHGTKMLNRDPSLEGTVMSWLLGTYMLATGEMVTPKPGSAQTSVIESEGETLQDAKK